MSDYTDTLTMFEYIIVIVEKRQIEERKYWVLYMIRGFSKQPLMHEV